MKQKSLIKSADGVSFLVPFVLVTFCFALWGFANDITNPMVKAFSKIFRMNVTDGTLVQVAFYGGYFCMAFPAAIFIRKYSYKAGVLMGLALYAIGALLFFPAKGVGIYGCFLVAYFIMTCGLSFLETSCNPYILTMGPEETATRRLNLAQCFNPCGSIIGMFVLSLPDYRTGHRGDVPDYPIHQHAQERRHWPRYQHRVVAAQAVYAEALP